MSTNESTKSPAELRFVSIREMNEDVFVINSNFLDRLEEKMQLDFRIQLGIVEEQGSVYPARLAVSPRHDWILATFCCAFAITLAA